MHKVTVDGVDYFPQSRPSIGVAISTYDRQKVLDKTLEKILEHTPGAYVVVVDDAGTIPAQVPEDVDLIRMETNGGIAATKNRGIEALMDHGCEHLFLFDDDAYPKCDDWWVPYADSPEPHLMYIFENNGGPKTLYEDGQHIAYSDPRGVMLYVHRSAVEVVGGMDTIYGRWGYEHGDWANRIHHAGLSSWRYTDVVESDKLIYSLDEFEKVVRSVPDNERTALAKKNALVHDERMSTGYTGYCSYRKPRKAVITALLTSTKDPQRGTQMSGDLKMIEKWAKSIKGATPVAIVDHDVEPIPGVEIVKVPSSSMNLYYRRWLLAYQYLRDNKDIDQVWVTDGTDVVMLREPWPGMEDGAVYVGSEPKTLDDEWMINNHKSSIFQSFLTNNYTKPMLNAGLLGGSRVDVMQYAHQVYRLWFDLETQRYMKKETTPPEMGDMAAFNLVGYEGFAEKIKTGPLVHTVFRAEEKDNNWAWWKHK